MPQTVSLRLPEDLISRLDRFARMLGNGATRARAGLILLDEALKESSTSIINRRVARRHARRSGSVKKRTYARGLIDGALKDNARQETIQVVPRVDSYFSNYIRHCPI